ncbi:MAG: hypothetical protein MUF84_17410, partial [Anaerolineae bacterium]|nr:hypothetical protein [Anaerolineae bacterium]
DYAWFELDNAAVHNYDLWIPNGTVLDASNNSTFTNHTGATLQVTKSTNLYTQFINDGTVSVVDPPGGYLPDATSLSICRGGTQTGSYNGTNDALLYFGVCYGGAQVPTSFTFALGSSLTTPRVTFYQPGHVHGTYGPVGSTSASYLYSPVTYYADATINGFGDMLSIYAPVTVLGTAPTAQYDLEVRASQANFSYGGTINVYHEFRCENNGKVSGGGLIRLMPTGTMRLYACTLDGKQVENQGTTYWYNNTVTGLSNSTLTNKGTFNLYPGLLMTGTMTLRNEELLTKNQVGTTTIAVPFENSGTVQILLGEVVFTHDVTLPVSSTTTIAGTLQVGELVNSGVLTVTGTVEGDLTNHGTLNLRGTVTGDLVNEFLMSPGSSPGVGVVTGSFTQTTAGSLKIELSKPGSEPVAAPVAGVDYDQLQIGGTAQLAGELSLVAGQTLAERPGEQISFLLATGGVSDTFETLELTEMIDESAWTLEYGAGAVAVRFADLAFVYLPLAVR